MDHESTGYTVFFIGWMVLGGAGFLCFHVNRDAAWKRRWWPSYIVASAAVFVLATFLLFPFDEFLLLLIPGAALVSWQNVRRTSFCDACGRTIYNYMGFGRLEYCSKCGARLPST